MSTQILATALALVALAVTACTGGGGSTPRDASTSDPTTAPSPSIEGIAHPTGADEIVLRFDESGGFVPPEFLAAHVPMFTLYGDGTVVFVQSNATLPARQDGIMTSPPVRTGKLTEDQVQALLEVAIRDGGLGPHAPSTRTRSSPTRRPPCSPSTPTARRRR